jgi:hypothetical protein
VTGAGAARGWPPTISPADRPNAPGFRGDRVDRGLQAHDEKGKALSTAAAFEIDDLIDPAQTRHVLTQTLARTRS